MHDNVHGNNVIDIVVAYILNMHSYSSAYINRRGLAGALALSSYEVRTAHKTIEIAVTPSKINRVVAPEGSFS